jgi:NADH:ubiquinone oxidoreductase subunit 4 (subunit M)
MLAKLSEPIFAIMSLIFTMANISLPGTNFANFVGEFLVNYLVL